MIIWRIANISVYSVEHSERLKLHTWNFCTAVIRRTYLNTVRFLWYKVCGSRTVNMAKMRICEVISVCTHWQNPSLNNQGRWEWERQRQNNLSFPPVRARRLKVTTNATYPGPQHPSGLLIPGNLYALRRRQEGVPAVPSAMKVTGFIPLCCNLCEM